MDFNINNIEPTSSQADHSLTATDILQKIINNEIIQDSASEPDNFEDDQIKFPESELMPTFDENETVRGIIENDNLFEDELSRDTISQNKEPTLTLANIDGLNENTFQILLPVKPKRKMNRKKTNNIFPNMLFKIINECQTGAIKWSTNGNFIMIKMEQFEKEYLKNEKGYFKTNKILSFIRQLNFYRFFKNAKKNLDENDNSEGYEIFKNENFRRDRPDLLDKITKRTNQRGINKENISPPLLDVIFENCNEVEQMSSDKRIDENYSALPIVLPTTNTNTCYINYSPVIIKNITNTFTIKQQTP